VSEKAQPDVAARLDALRAHLAEGAVQARQGIFVEGFSIDRVIRALDEEE
jgi:antitoxin ParD1/3/4